MSTRLIHRPARATEPLQPQPPLDMAAIPTIRSNGAAANAITFLMPVVGGMGMVMMMMSSGNPIRMAIGSVMFTMVIISAIAMFVRAKTGKRKEAETARTRFLEHLAEVEARAKAKATEQQLLSAQRHPAPSALTGAIRDPFRLWERRRRDEDALVLRLGSGTCDLAWGISIKEGGDQLSVPEPIAQAHADRMLARVGRIEDAPIAIPARGVVSLVGPQDLTSEAVRALLCQAATFHAPDDVRFHLALGNPAHGYDAAAQGMTWALWLPHLLSEDEFDGPLGRRQVSFDEDSAASLLEEIERRNTELKERSRHQLRALEEPYIVVVLDMDTEYGRWLESQFSQVLSLDKARITVIATSTDRATEPSRVDVRVSIDEDRTVSTQLLDRGEVREPKEGKEGFVERMLYGGNHGRLDEVSMELAESIARALSPLRLSEDAVPDAPLEQTIGLDSLLGIEDFATYDIAQQWAPRPVDQFLNVPFGIDGTAGPINLDIKESAKSGMGPHGLCVGATGSGKSEVLRTIVLAQVINHPPDQLSLVLVDFKGGATFAGLEPLPHTAAVVDNLADSAGMVDRLHDSILGEIQRRQVVLQQAGNLANVAEYNKLRDENPDMDPLPVLFVVIDEFGELLAAKPEFIELFVQIGRIGRSIGMHLLLASQRLEEGRLRGLESYLSYRVGLRTFSAAESRAAIGTTDAHALPPIPGSGYLKVDPDIFERFKAAYVSGPYVSSAKQNQRQLPPVPMPLELANTTESWLRQRTEEFNHQLSSEPARKEDRTTLDIVVSRLIPAAERTRQIWLPPLPDTMPLEGALGRAELTSDRGLSAARPGLLQIPLGLKDKPLDQWQGPLTVDLAGANGNIAVLGAPQSGKTTTLKTLVLSTALTHTPAEVSIYIADLAGSSFLGFENLPHVGDVTTRFDEDKLRRTFAEMHTFLAQRELLFAESHISSVSDMRRLHAEGKLPQLPSADIFFIIDGWATLRHDFEDLAEQAQDLASRGLGYGIHVIFATGRWADFRLQLQSVIGTKLEHRLNDALDSGISKKAQERLAGQPVGRVLSGDELIGQVALPHLTAADVVREGTTTATLASIAQSCPLSSAPPVRMLPEHVSLDELVASHGGPAAQPALVGLAESTLQPVRFDFDGAQRHLFIVGGSKSGKTTTLRSLMKEAIRGKQPGQLMFGIFDTRRALLGECPEEFLGEYAGTHSAAEILAKGIAKELERRLPPSNVTQEQLRDRSWWAGPEIFIVVDDAEHLEGNNGPLRPLVPFLPHAADIGLHVWAARRAAGVSRASYDAFLQGIRDNGANGLLLSGEKQEGAIWPKVYLQPLPAGRAQWVRGSGKVELVQLADTPSSFA